MGSVIAPERFKEVVVDPLAKTREMLFVGAIMNIVESLTKHDARDVHQLALAIRENVAKVAHDGLDRSDLKVGDQAKEACTRAFMDIMALAGKLDINVALGALRLHHEDLKQVRDKKDEVQIERAP